MRYFGRQLIIGFILLTPLNAIAFTLENTAFAKVGEVYGIDPLLLYSMSLELSAKYLGKGLISPSPYAIRSNHLTSYFDDPEEARNKLKSLIKDTDNIEVGLMQVSLHYHPQKDPLKLLDPYENLVVAAKILKEAIATTTDPILGVGKYFSWSNEEVANKKGRKVWTTYSRLRAIEYSMRQQK